MSGSPRGWPKDQRWVLADYRHLHGTERMSWATGGRARAHAHRQVRQGRALSLTDARRGRPRSICIGGGARRDRGGARLTSVRACGARYHAFQGAVELPPCPWRARHRVRRCPRTRTRRQQSPHSICGRPPRVYFDPQD